MSGLKTFKFRSIDELCSIVSENTQGWDVRWYRGVKDPEYTLLPRLFRNPEQAVREGYLSVEFRRRAATRIAGISSQFDWLCAMQHYGVPTRLLDWTESMSVSLYFTIRPLDLDLNLPTLWILDPFELYRLSFPDRSPIIPIPISNEVVANSVMAFEENDEGETDRTRLPIPVAPNFIFNRLANQNGCFTMHGLSPDPLEKACKSAKKPILLKCVAAEEKSADILNALDLIIPCDDAIFPDLEGLREQIV